MRQWQPALGADYHTVQMPKEVRKARYFSRREELQDPELLSALISDATTTPTLADDRCQRDAGRALHVGAASGVVTTSCVPAVSGAQSHPLALPLAPQLLEGNAADVLREAYRWYQDQFNALKLPLPDYRTNAGGKVNTMA